MIDRSGLRAAGRLLAAALSTAALVSAPAGAGAPSSPQPPAQAGSEGPSQRVLLAAPNEPLWRAVAVDEIDGATLAGRVLSGASGGSVAQHLRRLLADADMLAPSQSAAAFRLRATLTNQPKIIPQGQGGARAGDLPEIAYVLSDRGGQVVFAGAYPFASAGPASRLAGVFLPGDRHGDPVRTTFAAFAEAMAAHGLAGIRDAVPCAALNPDGIGAAYLASTPTAVVTGCRR